MHQNSLSSAGRSGRDGADNRASATPKLIAHGRSTTDARMFVLMAEDQTALVKIVGRHFDGHTIADQSLDSVLLHLACRVGHDLVAGIELNAIARVGQDLDHKAFELDEFFLGHFFIPSDRRGESRCCGARQGSSYDAPASPTRSARSA